MLQTFSDDKFKANWEKAQEMANSHPENPSLAMIRAMELVATEIRDLRRAVEQADSPASSFGGR